jgi:integrase
MKKLNGAFVSSDATDRYMLENFLALKRPATQTQYSAIIGEFQRFLTERNRCIQNLTDRDALAWATWALNQPGSPLRDGTRTNCTEATVLRKAVILHGYLKESGRIDHNPMLVVVQRLKGAKTGEKRKTKVFSPEEVQRMLDTPGKGASGLKARAFLALLFGGGLRLSEALNITLDDIQLENEVCYLQLRKTKGKSYEEQVLPSWAVAEINELVKARKIAGATSDNYLLVTGRGHRINDRNARDWFKRLARDAGIDPGRSPHSARATAITHLLASGSDYNSARIFARHSSFTMVAIYDARFRQRHTAPGLTLDYRKKTPPMSDKD